MNDLEVDGDIVGNDSFEVKFRYDVLQRKLR